MTNFGAHFELEWRCLSGYYLAIARWLSFGSPAGYQQMFRGDPIRRPPKRRDNQPSNNIHPRLSCRTKTHFSPSMTRVHYAPRGNESAPFSHFRESFPRGFQKNGTRGEVGNSILDFLISLAKMQFLVQGRTLCLDVVGIILSLWRLFLDWNSLFYIGGFFVIIIT